MRFIKGNDLRSMRLIAGLTTVEMAEAAGVKTRKTYENWEKNVGTPNVNQFIAMTKACHFPPADVIVHFMSKEQNNMALLIAQGK
ncbi:helix-turn-helix transcriptional regulator [Alteromonas sp. a30]|uniref:helix-turn-helix transcriptional regulator n=1 Tax=Alteromonas sp. a30 TaxID=2730917 RepID=UPI00228259C2|nr:helix-turn-helix transcriptional regulator [Alteromonas sp. a30]